MLESLSPIDVALIKKIGGNGSSYNLPIASPTVLGGVQPVAKTAEMTQSVGVDEAGALWTKEGSGGYKQFVTLGEDTLTEDVASIDIDGFSVDRLAFAVAPYGSAANSGTLNSRLVLAFSDGSSLTVDTGLNLVTNSASKAWNKSICFISVDGNLIDLLINRDGGSWNTDIYFSAMTSQGGTTKILRKVLPSISKITSLSIGLSSTGVIGANTQFKVVGA